MTSRNRPLHGKVICFVSTEAFGGIWRTWKQASSLREAGARVVFVGYEHLMPQSFSEAGFEVVAPRSRPLPPAPSAPVPPDPMPLREFPACPEAVVWQSSQHPNRYIRMLANRTVHWVRYLLQSWRNRRAHRHSYRHAIHAYSDAQLEYLEAQREYDRVAREHRKRAAHPTLWFDWEANAALIEAVVETGADVVHAVDLPSLDTAWKASREAGARLVYAAHELWVGFVRNPDFNPKPSHAAGLLAVERRLIGESDLVTVTSDTMGERLSSMYDLAKPLTLLNAPLTHVDAARPAHRPVRFVHHGGLSHDRNIEALIRAMVPLRECATLDVHGFERTVGAEELSRLVDSLNLGSVVHLHGPFEYVGVVEMLENYDVEVLAAKVVEENFEVTLPNRVFDALCAGVALAVYDAPAMVELLSKIPFGIILDTETPETITAGLRTLVDDPERLSRMKETAALHAPDYVWEKQGAQLVAAVENLFSTRATFEFRKKRAREGRWLLPRL